MGRILGPKSTLVASAAFLVERWWKELQERDMEGEPVSGHIWGPGAEPALAPQLAKLSSVGCECWSQACSLPMCGVGLAQGLSTNAGLKDSLWFIPSYLMCPDSANDTLIMEPKRERYVV